MPNYGSFSSIIIVTLESIFINENVILDIPNLQNVNTYNAFDYTLIASVNSILYYWFIHFHRCTSTPFSASI